MRYLNLDLNAFDYRADDTGEYFKVHVSSSPAGEQKLADAEEVVLPAPVRRRLHLLDRRRLTLAEMIDLGDQLAAYLFPPKARRLLDDSRMLLRGDNRLRIRLRLDAYALADIPWEYVYVPQPGAPAAHKTAYHFLALDSRISLVRYEQFGGPLVALDPVGRAVLRLVMLMADPQEQLYSRLDLDSEQQAIAKALAGVNNVAPEYFRDATVDVLEEALLHGAHIFHFAGHGDFRGDPGIMTKSEGGKGYLVLLNDEQHARLFPADRLAIKLRGRGVRLAVLAACEGGRRDQVNAWTSVAPALTYAGIPAVLAMQYTISDRNATAFSRAFYRSLAAGQPIDAAVSEGRQAIFNRTDEESDDRDWGVPVLYLRAEEGVLFPVGDVPSPDQTASTSAGATTYDQRQGVFINGGTIHGPVVGANSGTITTSYGGQVNPVSEARGEGTTSVDRTALRNAMVQAFSIEEIELLCADVEQAMRQDGIQLAVNLELVGGSGKAIKIQNLIQYLDRRGYLSYLVDTVRKARLGII